jgi:hypothetical protein
VYCEIYLTGDGGAEGSGAGQLRITLPFTASASTSLGGLSVQWGGTYTNGATQAPLGLRIQASATFLELLKLAAGVMADFTPGDQNNTSRAVMLSFSYGV